MIHTCGNIWPDVNFDDPSLLGVRGSPISIDLTQKTTGVAKVDLHEANPFSLETSDSNLCLRVLVCKLRTQKFDDRAVLASFAKP
jgi:hypothetical protein